MKRFLSILLICTMIAGAAFASDFHFVFDSLELNPTILKGFCPTVFTGGIGYTGLTVKEGNTTDIQLIAGGGKANRYIASYDDDSPRFLEENNYNVEELRYGLKVLQGLKKDLFTAYAGYDGRWEKYVDVNNSAAIVWDNHIISTTESDSKGLKSNVYFAGLTYNGTNDTMFTRDGVSAKAEFRYSPSKSGLSFMEAEAQAVFSRTVFQTKKDNGRNKFSVVFVDRAEISLMKAMTANDSIPYFAQEFHSLGRKVRGFEKFSYSTAVTAVNNLELRFASPELFTNNIFARLNLFIDAGAALGKELNSTNEYTNRIIASTGAVAELSIYDFVNVGAQFSYLLKGQNNLPDRAFKDKDLKMHIIFMLDY